MYSFALKDANYLAKFCNADAGENGYINDLKKSGSSLYITDKNTLPYSTIFMSH